MKKCSWCGQEYPDDASLCSLDQQHLVSVSGTSRSSSSPNAGRRRRSQSPIVKHIRTIGIYILRAIWLVFAFCGVWGLASGKAVEPLLPYNLVVMTALVVGTCSIWFSARRLRMLSFFCGIIAALMLIFQSWVAMTMFTSDAPEFKVHFRASLGPFDLEGAAAKWAIFLPSFLLLGFSAVLLIAEIWSRVLPVQEDGNETESV